jgi:Leucine-rich repeat (LRR) protein
MTKQYKIIEMKNLLVFFLLFTGMVKAQIVSIPDANFKGKLIALGFDTNNDGNIQLTEAENITTLNVSESNISDLTGIMSFPNLVFLYCSYNTISDLNVTGLSNLQLLDCSNNQITNINLTGVSNLGSLNCSHNLLTTLNGVSSSISNLRCNNNRLTSFNALNLDNLFELDISNNTIESFNLNSASNLAYLTCNSNLLTSLNVNAFSNLVALDCSDNNLTALNISNLSLLTSITCKINPELTSVSLTNLNSLWLIDLTGNRDPGNGTNVPIEGNINSLTLVNLPQLNSINCSYNKLTTLDLNNLSSLTSLDCSFNLLTNLSLTNLPNLNYLQCYVNKFQSLDVTALTSLTVLRCGSGYYNNNQITNVLQNLNVAGLSNLFILECFDTLISSIDLTGLTNLQNLSFLGIQNAGVLNSLDVSGCTNLKNLTCRNTQLTSLNVNNLTNLEHLTCTNSLISNLSLNGLLNLKSLDYSFNYLTNVNLFNLPLLEVLGCTGNQLTTLDISNLTSLKTLSCGFNQLTTLNLDGLISLVGLDFSSNNITLANISGISPDLVYLGCGFNNLTSLDLSMFPALEGLSCTQNQLTSLDLSFSNNLKFLDCRQNQISSLNLSNLNQLFQLDCSNNLLTSLNTSNLTDLWALQCSNNQITSLDLTNNQSLEILGYSNNPLPNLNLNNVPSLKGVSCSATQTTILDVSSLTNLSYLYCDENELQSLDVSNCPNLNELYCADNQLATLFLKNGANEQILDFSNNPNLQYICADTSQLESIQTQLNSMGMNTTVSNSYCSFSPGGNHNTVTGLTIFDDNNNGCEITDEVNPFIRLDINDGTASGSTVTNINGSYNFFTNAGSYSITPNVENPTWFNFSPSFANFSFPNNNNNISTQNFCIQAVGIHNDIEVVLAPIDFARPGFDATYKIVYKNKGNQMHSGTVTLNFDDSRIDFVSATPSVNSAITNVLTWNYINLMPFENRSILITLNTNSPQEIPAVNNGDILNFTTSITPVVNDELPNDNSFDFNQIVVGSYDPNDITCLEGDTVDPSEIGNYLHYVINFENLGTFYAENVVVRTEVDATKYDISTLQVMNTSHPSSTRITGNVVEFIFEDINLAEASGNPPVGGHGNVLFKIKTKEDLEVNEFVTKKAGIYFDYNFPIITNDAETTFAALNNPDFEIDESLTVYPNPTSSNVNITSDFMIQSIELYDIQGRILSTNLESSNDVNFDISMRQNGLYFLKIKTEKGIKVVKIVKE